MTDSQNDIGAPRPYRLPQGATEVQLSEDRDNTIREDPRLLARLAEMSPTYAESRELTREDVFNEVIYGLGVLLKAERATDHIGKGQWYGIEKALAYVRAMKEEEE